MTENLPVNWEEKLANEARDVAKLERPTVAAIGLRAGVMTYMNNPIAGNKMNAVIVAAIFERTYYEDAFDPNKIKNPVCFAQGTQSMPDVPSPDSSKLQSESCISCPHNQWGSAAGGGKGKACKERRKLMLIPADQVAQGHAATADMAVLSLPVTSIKNWANYVNNIATLHNRPAWAMLTEISVTPNAKTQFQVNFEPKGIVEDNKSLGEINGRIESATNILMQPYAPNVEQAEPPPDSGKARKFAKGR